MITHKIFPNGNECWYRNDEWHKDDAPAVLDSSGYELWFKYNNRHRKNAPALIFPDGDEIWVNNDRILK